MSTFETFVRFRRDYHKLARTDRARFERVVKEEFVHDLKAGRFRSGLRIKPVQAWPGGFEMTLAPDGRATWEYGPEQRTGEPHIIWRRIGGHEIFEPGPP